jgi:hypothetical protein
MSEDTNKYHKFGGGQLYLTTLTPFTDEEAIILRTKFQPELNTNLVVINNSPITYNYYMKLCTHQHNEDILQIEDDLNTKTKKELDNIINDLSNKRGYKISLGMTVRHSKSIIRLEHKYPYYFKPKFALYPTYPKDLLLACNLQDMKIVAKQFNIEWVKDIPVVRSNHRLKLINELTKINKIV